MTRTPLFPDTHATPHPDTKHGFLRGGDDELEPVQKQVWDVDREADDVLRDRKEHTHFAGRGETGSVSDCIVIHRLHGDNVRWEVWVASYYYS